MSNHMIRELRFEDKEAFLQAMIHSQSLHHPWVTPPLSSEEFENHWQRFQQSNQKSYLACDALGNILGVFNVSEIVRGGFQNAFLGFYGVKNYSGKGHMSASLKLIKKTVFEELALHRLEANIQPDNTRSIQLVKNNGFRYEGFSPRYLKINDKWCGHEHWAITLEDYLSDTPEVIKKDNVSLVPYNSGWPKLAQDEIDKLKSVFPDSTFIDIQHVGSTAISGLSAKPILDIQIAVHSLEDMKLMAVPILQRLGYEYWADNPDPNRMFFVKGMPPYGEQRTHHVHIFEHESEHWCNKLIFRNYLRSHAELAKEYEQLKAKLAQEHLYDREKYTDAKLEFVNRVLQIAKKL